MKPLNPMKLGMAWLADFARLMRSSARLVAGRRYWIAPFVPLVWLVFQVIRVLVGWRVESFTPPDAQTVLIGFPLTILGMAFGARIIAGELDKRTLEIAYTVPGGTHRVWIAKLLAAFGLLAVAETGLAAGTFVFCTEYPVDALYGALQAAVFYMVLSMALSALFRSEASGALATSVVLLLNLPIQGGQARISPFFNPEVLAESEPADLLAWTVQNRIGFALAIAAVAALAFARAERREKLLGS